MKKLKIGDGMVITFNIMKYIVLRNPMIKSISLDFIKGYENYLMNHIGNNRNTTTVNLKALAKLVGDIYRNYDMDETGNPFRKMRFKREQTDRTFLEIEVGSISI